MEYQIRDIVEDDIDNGFIETLDSLSRCNSLDRDKAKKILRYRGNNLLYKTLVAVHEGCVVSTATLFLEQKFTHDGGGVGHIEDVATRTEYRNNGIASAVVKLLIEYARSLSCYKVVLSCSSARVPFYKSLGFHQSGIEMRINLL